MAGRTVNLAAALLARAEGGERIALREPGRAWSYGELTNNVARVAGALRSVGVERGDRVAVLMPDGLETASSILGILHAGAIAVPILELGRANDIRAYLRDAEVSCAIVDASLEPLLDEVRGEISSLREVVAVGGARGNERSFEALLLSAAPVPAADTDADEPALILYSAGAAGAPKGVVHAHRGPLESFAAYGRKVLDLGEGDRIFSTIKLATAYGLGAGLIFPLAAGAEAIFMPEQPRSAAVFELVRTLAPTVIFATPSLYGQLLEDLAGVELAGGRPLAAARACVAGAEQLPVGLAARIEAGLGAKVLPGYGLTEAFHFVIATPPGQGRPGSSGVVVPGYRARVVGEDGHVLGPNEIGTLEVSGPSAGRAYWGRDEESKAVFRGEWLRTGDRFFVDGDGWFYHCGRADDLIKVSGKWVSPGEVEKTLLAHEAVWECAVVGAEDEHGLVKPLAYVVPNVGRAAGPELARELIDFVKREIAPYKYPRWIEFVDQLPKGPQGKVLRYKLQRRGRTRTPPPA
jgi:benzoate-CoA ligase